MQPAIVTHDQNETDEALVRRITSGDSEALRLLMRRYNQTMYRTARSILKDDSEAEDAVQDAYLLAYQAMSSFRRDSKLSTWLVRIVANEALGRLRKRSRRAEIILLNDDLSTDESSDAENAGEPAELPEAETLRAEARRLIEAKIDQLPEAFRTVFVLRTLEDMSVDETAACLSIPPATVRSRYFRAKGLLREALAREIDFSIDSAFSFAGNRCDRIVAGVMQKLEQQKARPA